MLYKPSIIQGALRGAAACLVFAAVLAGCSAPQILYFRASDTHPEISDTVTLSWKAKGVSQLYLQEYWIREQPLENIDEGSVWSRSTWEYPEVGNTAVDDSGTLTIYPPQWNRDLNLGIGFIDSEVSIQVRPLTESQTALWGHWIDSESALWHHSEVYLTCRGLIQSHSFHDAAHYLRTFEGWSGSDEELDDLVKAAVNARNEELFSEVVKVVKNDAENLYRAHNGINYWETNELLSLPIPENPEVHESVLLWVAGNDSINQVRFLLDNKDIWMTDFHGNLVKSVLDEALTGCQPQSGQDTSQDSIKREIVALLITSGAKKIDKPSSRIQEPSVEGPSLFWDASCECWKNVSNYNEEYRWDTLQQKFVRIHVR